MRDLLAYLVRCSGLRITVAFVSLLIFLLTASCTTHKHPPPADSSTTEKSIGKEGDCIETHERENRIRREYAMWKGTRHRLGGDGPEGLDCSGFVRAVYKNVFHIDLPRTTGDQVNQGIPVTRVELRAGDLVFFKPPSYPRHVGIYLSQDEFVHASKSGGVMISQIGPDYWGRCYWTARRILPISNVDGCEKP